MKLNECMEYITEKARTFGYTDRAIACFYHEIYEKVAELEDWTPESLDTLFEEYF